MNNRRKKIKLIFSALKTGEGKGGFRGFAILHKDCANKQPPTFPNKKLLPLFHFQKIFPCLVLFKPYCTSPQYPDTITACVQSAFISVSIVKVKMAHKAKADVSLVFCIAQCWKQWMNILITLFNRYDLTTLTPGISKYHTLLVIVKMLTLTNFLIWDFYKILFKIIVVIRLD